MPVNAPQEHTERLHALDATRAFALLLGVAFHAAWFYTPYFMNQAVFDARSNHFFGWFFFVSHSFRMQLFFVIAGFFARMLLLKRGFRGFCVNRWKRIGIPFFVGWAILYPLFFAVWFWGYEASGQMDFPVPVFLVPIFLFVSGAAFEDRADGGAFSLTHLWFLYHLMVFYLISVGARRFLAPVQMRMWPRLESWALRAPQSWLGLFCVSGLLAPLLWGMRGWNGVDTPGFSLIPPLLPSVAYLLFFLWGWTLQRRMREMPRLWARWRANLLLGLAISAPLYLVFLDIDTHETNLGEGSLEGREIADWKAFADSLNTGLAQSEDSLDPLGRVAHNLPESLAEAIGRDGPLTRGERSGLLMSINRTLSEVDLLSDGYQTPDMRDFRERTRSVVLEHRRVLDALWSGVEATGFRHTREYQWTKAAFSFGYAVMMVALVFGTLGAFQELCHGHSPAWRYFADASYWIYLVHIPVVPFLEILIFRWDLPGWIKLPGLLGVSFAILTVSYHYMVRSTFIGKALNGRKHPYDPNLWRAIRKGPH